ncbi:MAG: undecaprenyl-diphosphatase UppP [Gemmataceae bacterium]|nr:undecaprenyl-diphosphatase UppP [Gemmataceae bacterium]
MPLWQAAVLGLVQGLTEFLPISSTAHLVLVQEWFGRTREELANDPITVVIQLGTLAAVILYFRPEIVRMLAGLSLDLRSGRMLGSTTSDGRLAKLVLLATVPALIVGAAFGSKIKAQFYNPTAIALVSIVFALVLAASEWWAKRRTIPPRTETDLSWLDALIVGLFQACALMPGGSRSGTTLTACLFLGLARPAAARFSFLMSIPAIGAAGAKDLYDWLKKGDADFERQAMNLLVGTLVSFVVGYISIAWLMRFLQRYSTAVFVGYRLVLAAVILLFVMMGNVPR